MASDLLMPKLGLTMSEGVLLEWKVAPGDAFRKGQLLYVVETDKVATDIEADQDGVLTERLIGEGETVPVGAVLGRVEGKNGGAAPQPAGSGSPGAVAGMGEAPSPVSPQVQPPRRNGQAGRIVATPLARRIARERAIDLASVTGSGPQGRIKAMDVEKAADAGAPAIPATPRLRSGETARRSKPTAVQAAMARRLAAVKQGVPHFYLATEVEVSALLALRDSLNADPALPRLTLTHFVLAATGRALVAHPNINRVWIDGELLEYDAADVGLAIEADAGLFAPVLREAGAKSLDRIAAEARSLVAQAKAGRLTAADMQGGAVAVSNAGMHDVTWITPIINPGQSAILGVGSVRELFRPDEKGQPALRRELGLVFSGDHRVHTGVEGLAFLNAVKTALEHPLRLLREA